MIPEREAALKIIQDADWVSQAGKDVTNTPPFSLSHPVSSANIRNLLLLSSSRN